MSHASIVMFAWCTNITDGEHVKRKLKIACNRFCVYLRSLFSHRFELDNEKVFVWK